MVRQKIASIIISAAFLLLTLGLFNLEVISGSKFRQLSDKNCIRLLAQPGARGKILDREGNIIVDSSLSYDLMISAQDAPGREQALSAASKILGIGNQELKERFRKNFFSSSLPVLIAGNIDIKKAIALEEVRQDFAGLFIQQNPKRHYPHGRLAAHIIGYLSEIDRWRLTKLADYGYKKKDIVGFGGVEEEYDYYLRQEEGGLSVEVDHRGRRVRVLGFKPPENGKDIQLTINLKAQKIVEDNLSGRKGAVVIMDPNTGEIIAMASSPAFNPSIFVEKKNSSIAAAIKDRDSPLINRSIGASFPPASVFKLITAAAGLETKRISPFRVVHCPGGTAVGRRHFNCWSTHGDQDMVKAIAHSCDVYFYKCGLAAGAQNIHDYALRFGLARKTSFELPNETPGFIPSPLWRKLNRFQNWYDGDTANLSIGQGDCLVTPLQAVRMISVFANDGFLVTPYIVKAIDGKDISSYHGKKEKLDLKKSSLETIKSGLRAVVSEPSGTGSVLSALPVSVSGKTGTAQAPPGLTHAWFAGYFPARSARYAICVFLERAGPGYVACVLTRDIIAAMANEGLI